MKLNRLHKHLITAAVNAKECREPIARKLEMMICNGVCIDNIGRLSDYNVRRNERGSVVVDLVIACPIESIKFNFVLADAAAAG